MSSRDQAANVDGNTLGQQLNYVSQVIDARGTLGSNRDVFFVELNGFDTHSDMDTTLSTLLGYVNGALESFVEEMKGQGVWGNITLVSASDFGRTLTSNGLGTDHAVRCGQPAAGLFLKYSVHFVFLCTVGRKPFRDRRQR